MYMYARSYVNLYECFFFLCTCMSVTHPRPGFMTSPKERPQVSRRETFRMAEPRGMWNQVLICIAVDRAAT